MIAIIKPAMAARHSNTLYTIGTVFRAIRDAAGFVLITSPLWLLLAVVAVQMGVL